VSLNLFCHPREAAPPVAPPAFRLRKVVVENVPPPVGVRVPLADLALARRYHQAGDVRRAEQAYRQILQGEPGNAQVWYLRGAACQALGEIGEAVACMRQAVRLQPDHAEAHNHLGVLLAQQGQMAEAEASFRQALRCKPGWVEALNNLGLALKELERWDEAADTFREALRCQPAAAEAHVGLGQVLAAQDKSDEAIASFRLALRYKPDHPRAQSGLREALRARGKVDELLAFCRETVQRNPTSAEAHNELGLVLLDQGQRPEAAACFREVLRLRPSAEAHNNLGLALAGQGQYDEAIAHYQQAVRLKPDFDQAHNNLGVALRHKGRNAEAEASCREAVRLRPSRAESHNNLGLALLELGRRDEAVASLREALRLKPDFAQAYNNLGIAQWRLGLFEEAEASYRQALQLRPDFAESYNNLGNVLRDLGRLGEALAAFDQALRCKPDYADPHWNRSLVQLLQGELAAGWAEYEWRWQIRDLSRKPLNQPPWDGSSLHGRTILLYAEQGLGDTLQFIRYAPLIRQRGGRVVVECQKPLQRLLAGAPGIDRLLAQGETLPPFDVHAALLSLPRLFGTTLANIPADVPYLHAEAALVEQWRRELASVSGFKVGIAWQGSSRYREDHLRSIPLARFAPLAGVAGVRLISLQKGEGIDQLGRVSFPVTDWGDRLDEKAPFLDTAALMRNLDLVITSDTVVAHLAGALAVPVWVALPRVPDWRWLLERADSPWYPTVRLFRQDRRGDWETVFQHLAEALRKVAATSASRPVAAGADGRSNPGPGST
jgi:tetratricopeptide (TPR) repeat protein